MLARLEAEKQGIEGDFESARLRLEGELSALSLGQHWREREGQEARGKWYSKRCNRVTRSDYACFTVSITAIITMPMLR